MIREFFQQRFIEVECRLPVGQRKKNFTLEYLKQFQMVFFPLYLTEKHQIVPELLQIKNCNKEFYNKSFENILN